MAGRTTFIIAHRLATIRHADRILVLDHGRIVETGAPGALARAGGAYARMLSLQGRAPPPERQVAGMSEAGRLFGWIGGYALRRRAELAAAVALTGAQAALDVLKPWPVVFLIDHVLRRSPMPGWLAGAVEALPGGQDPATLANWVVAATVVLFLLEWACQLAARYVQVTLGQRVTYDVAADLLRRLQQMSLRFHTSRSVGDLVRRLTTDCASVAVVLRDALLPTLGAVVTLVTMFAVMWRIEPVLTLVAVAVAPAMAMLLRVYAGPMLEKSYAEQNAEAKIYEVTEQTFSAIPAVQVFGRERLNEALFRQAADGTLSAVLSALNVNLQFKVLIGLATAAGTAAMLWLGAEAVLAGRMSVGAVVLFLSYLALLYAPLQALMYTGSTVQTAAGERAASARRPHHRARGSRPARRGDPVAGARRGGVRGRELHLRRGLGRAVRRVAARRARREAGAGGAHRRGQDHPGQPDPALLRSHRRPSAGRRPGPAGCAARQPARPGGAGAAGAVPVPAQRSREHRLRPPGRLGRRGRGRRPRRPRPRVHRAAARRLRHRHRRARGARSRAASASGCRSPARCSRTRRS